VHILFFGDQHPLSLGGAQVSMRLQRQYLERAGHTVTVVTPRPHGALARAAAGDAAYLDLPSFPVALDREYAFTWPGRPADRVLDDALRRRAPVDLVHVQADFWGAVIGHRYAARAGVPVVHTMHNRVDVGIRATVPFPGVVLRGIGAWQQSLLPEGQPVAGGDGWAYQRRFAVRSDAVTAPSGHFARRLERAGVRTRAGGGVDVVWNGVDDDLLDRVRAETPAPRPGRIARLVWIGRMSPEKRLLPFLRALAASGVRAEVDVLGGGGQLGAAKRLVEKAQPAASVTFSGRIPYVDVLRRLAAADALVQTSIGFETQGMTPFEAAALGTPTIVSDPDVGHELCAGLWQVPPAYDPQARVDALAATLRQAVSDIGSGDAPRPSPEVGERFRQSSRTAAMLDVYGRVLDGRSA
jgi:glycosyltransferase involved in cell wall biosynthesis